MESESIESLVARLAALAQAGVTLWVLFDLDETLGRRDYVQTEEPMEGWMIVRVQDDIRNWQVRPSALSAIEILKSAGIKVGILTSGGDAYTKEFLKAVGLVTLFDAIYGKDSEIPLPTGPWVLIDDLDYPWCPGPWMKIKQVLGRDYSFFEEEKEKIEAPQLVARHFVHCEGFWPEKPASVAANRRGDPDYEPEDADASSLTGLVTQIMELLVMQASLQE